jgi:hypothetical protein
MFSALLAKIVPRLFRDNSRHDLAHIRSIAQGVGGGIDIALDATGLRRRRKNEQGVYGTSNNLIYNKDIAVARI